MMVYLASALFLLGLLLLASRFAIPLDQADQARLRLYDYLGFASATAIFVSCMIVAYSLMLSPAAPGSVEAVTGDFGLSSVSRDKANAFTTNFNPAAPSLAPGSAAPQLNQTAANSTAPSVFSSAQADQICEGFAEVSLAALTAGTRGEAFSHYEAKARQINEKAMRLPFVREAGIKPAQQITAIIASMVEDQYYISSKDRAVQLSLIEKVDRKTALDAMLQICEMKILEIRQK